MTKLTGSGACFTRCILGPVTTAAAVGLGTGLGPRAAPAGLGPGLGDGGGVDLGLDGGGGMGGQYGSDGGRHEVVVDPMALHLQQPQGLPDDAWAPPQLRRGQQRLGFNKHEIVTGYS